MLISDFVSPHVRYPRAALILGLTAAAACSAEPIVPEGEGSGGTQPAAGKAPMGSAGTDLTPMGGRGSSVGGSGGAGGGSGSSGAGGASGSGGAGGTSGTVGVSGTGGTVGGSAGMSAGGGGMAAGMGGTSAGAAGAPAGGMSAGGSAGSGGGGKAPVVASAGCGKASPQTGSANSPLNVSSHQYYVKIPAAYDAAKPYVLLFVFNPTNNPLNWGETSAGFESNGAKDAAIRVYPGPANSSSGWGAGDVAFFRPLYDQVIANFCVDKARVFATGESSGGDFSSILGCEHAEVLRGVAPCATKNVNGYPLDANSRDCTGQVESIVIHGKNDNVVGPENGPKTRDFYVALNHCETTPAPVPVPNFTDTMSNCVEYQGCDPGYPVFWCQHTDPEYSNTNHGWPKFAAKFVWEQFSKL
jgi:polyhydroxybutyrate depolymerase